MVTFQHVSPSHIPTFFTAQHFYIFSLDFKIVCLDFTIQHPYISHSYTFLLFLLSTISTFFIVHFHSLDFTIVLFFPCLTFLHFSPSNIPTFFHCPTFLTVQNFLILSVQQSYISFFSSNYILFPAEYFYTSYCPSNHHFSLSLFTKTNHYITFVVKV